MIVLSKQRWDTSVQLPWSNCQLRLSTTCMWHWLKSTLFQRITIRFSLLLFVSFWDVISSTACGRIKHGWQVQSTTKTAVLRHDISGETQQQKTTTEPSTKHTICVDSVVFQLMKFIVLIKESSFCSFWNNSSYTKTHVQTSNLYLRCFRFHIGFYEHRIVSCTWIFIGVSSKYGNI